MPDPEAPDPLVEPDEPDEPDDELDGVPPAGVVAALPDEPLDEEAAAEDSLEVLAPVDEPDELSAAELRSAARSELLPFLPASLPASLRA